jgi:nitrite reductase/ring-hydroxylating ferredoxin subunit
MADTTHALPAGTGLFLCEAHELKERGQAFVFPVLYFGDAQNAFALRFEGQLVAYLNRCLHVPTEMDWQHGEFLDADKSFIICSIHGAVYDPPSGRCVAGPCGKGRLRPVKVTEHAGQVFWHPDEDVQPVPQAQ